MTAMSTARCDCGREYPTAHVLDRGQCPRCQAQEDRDFANDTTSAEIAPWRMSRRSMQERLGVTENEDV